MSLPVALQELSTYRAFLVCRLDPLPNGKTNKVPVDPVTGYEINAHDYQRLLSPDEAAEYVRNLGNNYRIGFVLIPTHGFFALDLDHCTSNGQWAPQALSMLAMFPGAGIETSVSGEGLHVIGRFQEPAPRHRKKIKSALKSQLGFGMELYTSLRFICLGGGEIQGSFLSDHTAALSQLIEGYFQPEAHDTLSNDDWTDAPVAAWKGPQDDDELIRRMRASRGASIIFGGKASFDDLWNANPVPLSAAFPSTTGDSFDRSSADQALANRLAWWTGSDCERMFKLMWKSNLVRDKWDRDDYIRGTILKAATSQTEWYKERGTFESPATAGVIPTPTPEDTPRSPTSPEVTQSDPKKTGVGGFLFLDQQIQYFAGCTYVEDANEVMTPDGYMLTQPQFNARYSGHKFVTEPDGSKPTNKAWDAFVMSTIHRFPKVRGAGFYPTLPANAIIEIEGEQLINIWRPVDLKREPGNIDPFLTHLYRLYPAELDREVLLNYMRAVARYPGKKFGWAPFLQGVEGNGKTFFSHALERCVGRRYTHWPKSKEIDSKFNAAFYGKLLICVEDAYISEDKNGMWETLKPMITNTRLEIEFKGVDKATKDVCFNFILNSNHKDGVRKTKNDRRIAPLFSAQQDVSHLRRDGMDDRYFKDLYQWAEGGGYSHIAHYLLTSEISDQLDPGGSCTRAPKTTSTTEAISAGMGAVEQAIIEAIEMQAVGFAGGWVSSHYLSQLLKSINRDGITPRRRKEIMLDLGYEFHPMLKDGMVLSPIPAEGRSRLWIKQDHVSRQLNTSSSISKAYLDAQNRAMVSAAESVPKPQFGVG